jgi:hypothetical protein
MESRSIRIFFCFETEPHRVAQAGLELNSTASASQVLEL